MAHPKDSKRLSPEDKELLSSLPALDVYRPLIDLLNLLVDDQGKAILNLDLALTDDRSLAVAKARYEGAGKLVQELHRILARFKKPE